MSTSLDRFCASAHLIPNDTSMRRWVTPGQGQQLVQYGLQLIVLANIPVMSSNLFIIPGHNSVFTASQSQHYNWV